MHDALQSYMIYQDEWIRARRPLRFFPGEHIKCGICRALNKQNSCNSLPCATSLPSKGDMSCVSGESVGNSCRRSFSEGFRQLPAATSAPHSPVQLGSLCPKWRVVCATLRLLECGPKVSHLATTSGADAATLKTLVME